MRGIDKTPGRTNGMGRPAHNPKNTLNQVPVLMGGGAAGQISIARQKRSPINRQQQQIDHMCANMMGI